MVLGKKVAIFDWEWGRNAAPRYGKLTLFSISILFCWKQFPTDSRSGLLGLFAGGSSVSEISRGSSRSRVSITKLNIWGKITSHNVYCLLHMSAYVLR